MFVGLSVWSALSASERAREHCNCTLSLATRTVPDGAWQYPARRNAYRLRQMLGLLAVRVVECTKI